MYNVYRNEVTSCKNFLTLSRWKKKRYAPDTPDSPIMNDDIIELRDGCWKAARKSIKNLGIKFKKIKQVKKCVRVEHDFDRDMFQCITTVTF